jgi:hypothetical protein
MQQKAKISLLFKIDKGMEGFFLKEKERRKGRPDEQKARRTEGLSDCLHVCKTVGLLDL